MTNYERQIRAAIRSRDAWVVRRYGRSAGCEKCVRGVCLRVYVGNGRFSHVPDVPGVVISGETYVLGGMTRVSCPDCLGPYYADQWVTGSAYGRNFYGPWGRVKAERYLRTRGLRLSDPLPLFVSQLSHGRSS